MNQVEQQSPVTQAEVPVRRPEPKKKLNKKTVILALVAAAALFFGYRILFKSSDPVAADSAPVPTAVVRGNLSSVVTGSGTVQPIEQYTIVSLVSGDILQDFVAVGDEVQKDQLLYVLDSQSAQNSIERAQISLQQQQLSNRQTQDSIANLTVRMPISGILQNLYVKEGDSVNSGAVICDIVNTDELTVKLPFHATDADNISIGQAATVYLEASGDSITGQVTAKASGSSITDAGNIVTTVTLTFRNPGAVVQGASATAIVGSYACSGAGSVEYGATEKVTAKSSGDIVGLTKAQGDRVTAGETLFTLDNQTLLINSQSGSLSLQNAQLSLNDSISALDNYNIKSPISGQVISKSYKAGDTLDSNRTELAVVADMSRLTFTMNIDELDVKDLKVGQRVEVMADALEGVVFDGYIESIGIMGTGSSGVTTYPVEVIIEEYEGLLPGMNVTADIVTAEAQNVIQVPVTAVGRGNVVLITQAYADQIGAAYPDTTGTNGTNGNGGAQQPGSTAAPTDGTQPTDASEPSGSGGMQAVPQGQDGSLPSGANPSIPDGASRPEGMTRPDGAANGNNGTGGRQVQIQSNVQAPGTLVQRSGAPDGYVWLKVETGMSDGDMIEITAGLEEGATIYVIAGMSSSGSGMGGMGGGPGGERVVMIGG